MSKFVEAITLLLGITAIILSINVFILGFITIDKSFKKEEIHNLENQRTILIENYLSKIPQYKKRLWRNEKEKQQFLLWLECAAKEMK